MNRKILLLLLASCALSSCRIHYRTEAKSKYGQGIVLASKEDEAGRVSSWRLYHSYSDSGSRIDRTETFTETTPRIGLTVGPVTRERAQAVGVDPFEGVWVTAVDPNSAAASVGISIGDIVLNVDGVEVTSREQFEDYYDQNAIVGEPLVFSIRVYRRHGEPINPQQHASVEIRPVGFDVRESSTDSIPLEGSAGILQFTGLRLAILPAELCEELYGEGESRILVSGVVTGSPAYYAGLRGGDLLLSCDGKPVESLNDIRAAVLARVADGKLNGSRHDLFESLGHEKPADPGSDIVLEVEGTGAARVLGKHTAYLGVTETLEADSGFYIPIIVDYESDVNSADVSFLDFIFQFGFNYESRVRYSPTREPLETWELSILPLGMFEFEKGYNRSRTTLFWVIDFETN